MYNIIQHLRLVHDFFEIQIHIHAHTYIHTGITGLTCRAMMSLNIMHACKYSCIYMHTHRYHRPYLRARRPAMMSLNITHAYTYACIYMHMHRCHRPNLRTQSHIHAYTCIHTGITGLTCVHNHIFMHIRAYTQVSQA